MLLWPLILLMDALVLRILPGLEVDNWLTALGAAVALFVGIWPIGFLAGIIDVSNPWIFLGVAAAVNSVILMMVIALSTGLRSKSAVAVPVAGALIAGLNYYVAPVVAGQVMAAAHAHWH